MTDFELPIYCEGKCGVMINQGDSNTEIDREQCQHCADEQNNSNYCIDCCPLKMESKLSIKLQKKINDFELLFQVMKRDKKLLEMKINAKAEKLNKLDLSYILGQCKVIDKFLGGYYKQ